MDAISFETECSIMKNRKSIVLDVISAGSTVEEKLKIAKEAGFAAVEASAVETDEERQQIAELYKKYDLVCPSIMGHGAWENPATSPDPEVRKRSAYWLRQGILTAKALGADTLLVVPGVVNADIDYETAWENSHKVINEVLPFAAENGIYLAIEEVWNKFLLSGREMAEFIDSFDSPWVKAYFDIGNILFYGYPQHWIKSLGSRIAKIHVKGFKQEGLTLKWVQLLEGDINWKACMDQLRAIGFDGYITAELGPDERGYKGIADDLDVILSM